VGVLAVQRYVALSARRRGGHGAPRPFVPIDGKPIVTNDDGPAVFHLIHHKRRGDGIVSKWHTVLNRSRRSTHWVKVKNL